MYVCMCLYVCVCMCVCVCVCVWLHMCGWLCALYDELSWLREWLSLTMSTPNLVVWVSAQGICCRSIFMLYCVHGHYGVIVPIHITWVILVSPYMWPALTCLMLWKALTRLVTSMLMHVAYTRKPMSLKWHGSGQSHCNDHAHSIAWICTYNKCLEHIPTL